MQHHPVMQFITAMALFPYRGNKRCYSPRDNITTNQHEGINSCLGGDILRER
jgi:hypothetical protein